MMPAQVDVKHFISEGKQAKLSFFGIDDPMRLAKAI
ncbi:hypothetical protein NK6_5744 [Bradyrhizobium diazoefficiens]|uniref:Uncharacterized protein n=1 Tax=Bradyrhizobium diazoefficiens TaxID=1355477 RepID=A0A0E4BSK2_9BRAD|nr:hypothetical protein NK6_5744 [Bradyrhizobium diazoefficiens]